VIPWLFVPFRIMLTPLHLINGPSNDLCTRGRLSSLTGLLRTEEGHKFCRAIMVTDLQSRGRDIAFWNLSETHYDQLKSLLGKCVQVEKVASAPSRAAYAGRAAYSLNFNGGMQQSTRSTPSQSIRQQPPSMISEIPNDILWPQDPDYVQPSLDGPLTVTHGGTVILPGSTQVQVNQATSTQIPVSQEQNRLIPPPDLVQYNCLQCQNGSSPTCGVTGLPHPEICPTCGMLGFPVVRYCPMTGQPHPY